MPKYNITINELNKDNHDSYTAQGFIVRDGEEIQFEAATIWWDNTRRWKVKEEGGLAVSVEQSDFSQGERMSIARWLKAVTNDDSLIGKSNSQGSGRSGGGSSKRVQELTAQNEELKNELGELKAMMMQFMAQQAEAQQAEETPVEDEVVEEKPKKRTRKSRSKKS
jgi:hypothetical protein